MTIKKLYLGGMDLLGADLDKFARLFPDLVTEERDETGRLKKSIDFEKFKARFSADIISEGKERYEFTWPGKRAAMAEANLPINKTLRPVMEESKNWDSTENLYIEGDNLEVLKLLQESYLGKVKMIYIDPPYNTGNDFVYNDDFKENLDEYNEDNADYDDEGGKLVKNTESNGRFHSDWCSMIYPRLRLAKNLLSKDGVIFISMDDNEHENLKKICDEVYDRNNLIVEMIVNKSSQIASENIVSMHEYVLAYAKEIESFTLGENYKFTISRGTVGNENQTTPIIEFPKGLPCYNIADGIYEETRKIEGSKENIINYDPIIVKDGKLYNNVRLKARWRSSNDMRNFFANNCKPTKAKINGEIFEIYFENDRFNPQIKKRVKEKINSLYLKNKRGSKYLEDLEINYFDNPKDPELIKYIAKRTTNKDSLILDFFSGSATAAHAVMDLNAEDGGKRKYIMVQLPEETDENSEAYKAGYKNICEIGKERIRRAGEKILADNKDKEGIENLDTGFRVLRVDSTNMNDVAIEPNFLEQDNLEELESNIKADRTDLDLLFACLLAWGLPLDRKHESEDYHGFTIHSYNEGDLIACFDEKISEEAIKYMAQKEPLRVVFRDSCFKSSQDKINVEEIFKIFSPETDIRVL